MINKKDIEKQEKLKIVNKIIIEISSRGRNFFNGKLGKAELYIKKGRIYYISEYNGKHICLSIPDYRSPKNWHHGGTLLALCKEFRNYIQRKEKIGYERSGLYCTHWGYSEDDMQAIQNLAKELGYLI